MEINEHVHVEEYYEGKYINSPNAIWRVPSVVRLRHYIDVRKRRKKSSMKRAKIFIRDKHRCSYCGHRFPDDKLTLDHVQPKCRGGLASPENLVTSCFNCNQKKGDRTPEEAGMPLLHNNRKIKLDNAMLMHYADANPNWQKYLFLAT